MTINQNLRDLRRLSGLTQEEVADRVGLTRQAISGYESGRTQPDLDMLAKLAEVYNTDILGILYGRSDEQKKLRQIRIAEKAMLISVLALILLHSCLLLAINLCFPVTPGAAVEGAVKEILEVRFALLRAASLLQGLVQLPALVGSLVLAVLLTQMKRIPQPGKSALHLLVLAVGALLFTLPFAAADNVYSTADYLLILFNLSPVVVLLLYLAVLTAVRHIRSRADKQH